jgi:hypothetical protein
MGICPKHSIFLQGGCNGKDLCARKAQRWKRGRRTPLEIVAVTGVDLKVYHSHIRKTEVEHIAADLGAEIVYLPRGEGEGSGGGDHGAGRKRRQGGGRQGGQE